MPPLGIVGGTYCSLLTPMTTSNEFRNTADMPGTIYTIVYETIEFNKVINTSS